MPKKSSNSITLISIFCLLLFSLNSCKKNKPIFEDYSRDNDGYYYKLLAIGDGNENPKVNDVVLLDAVIKTQKDSIIWDSKNEGNNTFYLKLNSNSIKGTFNPYLFKMTEGDSASFLIHTPLFFKTYFNSEVPSFCQYDSLIKIDIKLLEINTAAEYEEIQSKVHHVDDKELEELEKIDAYLKKNNLPSQPDENGIYWINYQETCEQDVEYGKTIKIKYEGSFLDGRKIDILSKPMEFMYGSPDQIIKGLNIVIGAMKKGENAKIIVPSRLAFGEKGSANGTIPPYSSLVYNIEIIDIK